MLTINHRAIAKALMAVAVALTLIHIATVIIWYEDLLPIDDWLYISFFDLDEEESLGTWFSSLILLLASLLSLFQARAHATAGQRWYWLLLAAGFCLLSLDEVAGFHEFVNTMAEDTHWTSFALVLVAALGLAFLPFLFSLPATTRWLLVLAGLIYIGGAVGVERATVWHEDNNMLDTLAYNLWTALEEFMEMSGIILYLYTILRHLVAHKKTLNISVQLN